MHPCVFSFYLKLSVRVLMHVNVEYFENDREGVRRQYTNTFLESGVYKYRQYINLFMMAYMEMVKEVMKAKLKLIIVKNDFADIKMVPRGRDGLAMYSQPRMMITLSLPRTLSTSAAQNHHTANCLLNAETSINHLMIICNCL